MGCAIRPTRGGIESVLTHIFEEWCIDVQSDKIPAVFSGKRCTSEAIGIHFPPIIRMIRTPIDKITRMQII